MDPMIQQLAEGLGAEVIGTVPEYSAGAFGVAKAEQAFRERRDAQHRVRELRREWDDRP